MGAVGIWLLSRICGGILVQGARPHCKAVHPQTQEVSWAFPGFKDKNRSDRQTPCHQDFLRKFARGTDAQRLPEWFNREVLRCLRALKVFDEEGLFIGDASYCRCLSHDTRRSYYKNFQHR